MYYECDGTRIFYRIIFIIHRFKVDSWSTCRIYILMGHPTELSLRIKDSQLEKYDVVLHRVRI